MTKIDPMMCDNMTNAKKYIEDNGILASTKENYLIIKFLTFEAICFPYTEGIKILAALKYAEKHFIDSDSQQQIQEINLDLSFKIISNETYNEAKVLHLLKGTLNE